MKTFINNTVLFRWATIIALVGINMTSFLFAGGDRLSPRIVGMGRTFAALSRGLDAVGTNPANLALNDRDATFTFNLIPFGVAVGSDFINYKIYMDYFTGVPDPSDPKKRVGKYLSDADKNEILKLFPEGIGRTQANAALAPIGFSIQSGNFGMAIIPLVVRTGVNLDLTESYLRFPLNGNANADFTEARNYSFQGTAINASTVGEINFSAGYVLPIEFPAVSEIAAGLGVKYLIGMGYAGTEHYNANINVEGEMKTYTDKNGNQIQQFVPTNIIADFDFLQYFAVDTVDNKPVGRGLGVDIGVSALLMNSIRAGISITDIGSMKWDKYTKAIVGSSRFALKDIGNKETQDSLAKGFKGETKDTTAFSYSLPTALHVGVAMRVDDILTSLPFRWEVAADMHVGFNNVAGNTTLAQFALGTELDPLAGWLPLRTGILIGGRERFSWAAGFGLHFANTFDLDFATQSIALITYPESFRTLSFTMGMRFRF